MNANTRYYHIPIAEAALDGYMKTCSKTCFCNNQDNKGQGWWHFQFPTVTTISEVQLISCYDGQYIQYYRYYTSIPRNRMPLRHSYMTYSYMSICNANRLL